MRLNKNILLLITSVAAVIQLVIITYNHVTGFIDITGPFNFIIRLLIGTFFTSVFGIFIVFLDFIIINLMDKTLPLPGKLAPRIPIEIILTVLAGILTGTTTTITADFFFPYSEDLIRTIINNSLITSVINLIIIFAIEAVFWFKRGQENLVKAEKYEKENMLIRFETLKSQLNPHFLFNSLNVLSSLIKKNPEKAQEFVDEFSSVYRYTLDVIDKPVVELREEIEFAKSFLYLQKIRFEDAVETSLNIDADKLSLLVPPLAVQTLLENTFKHNKASENSPLKIEIFSEENMLVVQNNLQSKINIRESRGVGLKNLRKRYELLSDKQPGFTITENTYKAVIPLIKSE